MARGLDRLNFWAFVVYLIHGSLVVAPLLFTLAHAPVRARLPTEPDPIMGLLGIWAFALVMGVLGAVEAALGRPNTSGAAVGRGFLVGLVTVPAYFLIVTPLFDYVLTASESEFQRARGWAVIYGFWYLIAAVPLSVLAGAMAGWTLFKVRGPAPDRESPPLRLGFVTPPSDAETVLALVRRAVRGFFVIRLLLTPIFMLSYHANIAPSILWVVLLSTPLDGTRNPRRLRVLAIVGALVPVALVLVGLQLRFQYERLGPVLMVLLSFLLSYEVAGALLAAWPPRSPVRSVLALTALGCVLAVGVPAGLSAARQAAARNERARLMPPPTIAATPTPAPRFVLVRESKASWIEHELMIDATLEFTDVQIGPNAEVLAICEIKVRSILPTSEFTRLGTSATLLGPEPFVAHQPYPVHFRLPVWGKGKAPHYEDSPYMCAIRVRRGKESNDIPLRGPFNRP